MSCIVPLGMYTKVCENSSLLLIEPCNVLAASFMWGHVIKCVLSQMPSVQFCNKHFVTTSCVAFHTSSAVAHSTLALMSISLILT